MHGNYCGSEREQSGEMVVTRDVNAPEAGVLAWHKSYHEDWEVKRFFCFIFGDFCINRCCDWWLFALFGMIYYCTIFLLVIQKSFRCWWGVFQCFRMNNYISLQQMKISWSWNWHIFGFWLCRGIAEAACGTSGVEEKVGERIPAFKR